MLLQKIQNAHKNKDKLVFVLIDPDKFNEGKFISLINDFDNKKIDILLVGGSLIANGDFRNTIAFIKKNSNIPICIFPGNCSQLDERADAILFTSLVSGRNPDFLIGNQVLAAPIIKKSNIEVISTAYMLIDGGKITSVHYMSSSLPIPSDKPEIAVCTALAGQMIGMKCVYMDAGSGAINHIPFNYVSQVASQIDIPLIVGGGIRKAEIANQIFESGATAIVLGTIIEENPSILNDIKK